MVTKALKIFSAIAVIGCLSLTMFITPSMDNSKSILAYNSSYNLIPYVENNDLVKLTNSAIGEYDAIDAYTGTITGYGPDCKGCIGITASGYRVATLVDGKAVETKITYEDKEYGTVRILAAATKMFPFGTIVRISGPRIDGYITGIVLDRGGAMNNAYGEGKVLMDLLFDTEFSDEVWIFGRQHNVKFEILRYGY